MMLECLQIGVTILIFVEFVKYSLKYPVLKKPTAISQWEGMSRPIQTVLVRFVKWVEKGPFRGGLFSVLVT